MKPNTFRWMCGSCCNPPQPICRVPPKISAGFRLLRHFVFVPGDDFAPQISSSSIFQSYAYLHFWALSKNSLKCCLACVGTEDGENDVNRCSSFIFQLEFRSIFSCAALLLVIPFSLRHEICCIWRRKMVSITLVVVVLQDSANLRIPRCQRHDPLNELFSPRSEKYSYNNFNH